MTYKKKLIEVALPLEAINRESAREKSIRHGHPSTLHLWWSRKPLATCRAVLFASLVDDPSSHPDKFPTEEAQEAERQRLFRIIEELVKWENINNEYVLNQAREEILKSTDGNPPPVYDPFCGGGSIPLEAQRLGLEAHASDLNPVAVLITKALIEIPPKFANIPPVNPEARKEIGHGEGWRGAQGLAEDVRYYGRWMRDEAEKKIGHLYPKVKLPKEQGGGEATVIAWLWARTVKCPNPACGAIMPLTSKFHLSTKQNKKAWVEPVIDRSQIPPVVCFEVKTGSGDVPSPPKSGRGAKFKCLTCSQTADEDNIRAEFQAKRNGTVLLAIVAESKNGGRIYVAPSKAQVSTAINLKSKWKPEEEMNQNTSNLVSGRGYGITHWHEIFTSRQLLALTTFNDLVREAREKILAEAINSGMPDDKMGLNDSGTGAMAYADAVTLYLALGVSKLSDYNSSIALWSPTRDQAKATFARQALPMTWDFAEVNPFAEAAGDIVVTLKGICEALVKSIPTTGQGWASQVDSSAIQAKQRILISTDPPYYDNICYSDLSDYFYIWLRRSLGTIFPDLFSTMLVPKTEELVATPYRFNGDRVKARSFFEEGLANAFEKMRGLQHDGYPITVYYAFKQAEDDENDSDDRVAQSIASTGWETMLEGLLKAAFQVTGTWPMRSERTARSTAISTNALASSIVLVCRPRPENASMTTRRDFLSALKKELPDALRKLQQGNIAPVDLAQAAIGPGMAVFSRYSKVIEADGSPMKVRTALALINQTLDEVLIEQEGEIDSAHDGQLHGLNSSV